MPLEVARAIVGEAHAHGLIVSVHLSGPGGAALALDAQGRAAGVFDKGRDLLAERPGVLGAQLDLVAGAAEPEAHCLIRRAPIQVVLKCDGNLLCHPGLPTCGH